MPDPAPDSAPESASGPAGAPDSTWPSTWPASSPSTAWPTLASRSARATCSTSASGTIRPTDPTRSAADRAAGTTAASRSSTWRTTSSPRARRTDTGGSRPGAMVGSRRAAYSMTSPGTRNPFVSCSTCASALPRWVNASSHDRVAHGVVACARSPSTVVEPVEQRRPIARSIIGLRSCASSATTCPTLAVRSTRSAASSMSTASARVQRAEPGPFGGLAQDSRSCSSSLSSPSALAARNSRSPSSRSTSRAGSTVGHS